MGPGTRIDGHYRRSAPGQPVGTKALPGIISGEGFCCFDYLMFTGTPGFFKDRQGAPPLPLLHDRIHLDHPDAPFPNPEWLHIVLPRFDREKLKTVAENMCGIRTCTLEHQ